MWRKVKLALGACVLALLLLLGVLLLNTARYSADNLVSVAGSGEPSVDIDAAVNRLAASVRFPTVSDSEPGEAFDRFLAWLPEAFPQVHQQLSREIVGGHTPVYIWQGRNTAYPAILLAAHYDVVPVQAETLVNWTYPPYQGEVAEGYVWGRGTIDNKGALIAILSATEQLLEQGFEPERTIIFSFGHDEEIKGDGARAAVAYLREQPFSIAWSLDEGSFVFEDVIPGLSHPVASINVAEKGAVTLELTANAEGGHSSMPPRQTAVGVLGDALSALQKEPLPGGLQDISAEFFAGLGPHFDYPQRVLFANQWLFKPVLEHVLGQAPTTNALLRTTTAPTMLKAAPAPNVLPTQATATVNFRIHPRDSVDSVKAMVKRQVSDDRVKISTAEHAFFEPSSVSDHNTEAYTAISTALATAFGELITVPGLTIAATDSRIYQEIADNSYRINPFLLRGTDLPLLHGIDERLSLENLERAVMFYTALLRAQ